MNLLDSMNALIDKEQLFEFIYNLDKAIYNKIDINSQAVKDAAKEGGNIIDNISYSKMFNIVELNEYLQWKEKKEIADKQAKENLAECHYDVGDVFSDALNKHDWPADKEELFKAIMEVDNFIHANVKIKNQKLNDLLKGHICICGSLIFTSFLPDDIRSEYSQWYYEQVMDKCIEGCVNDLKETVDKSIINRLIKSGKY